MTSKRSTGLAALLLMTVFVGRTTAQDQLTAARDLYAAASYEDALTVLNGLLQQPAAPEDKPKIQQYRAFCLLALGRASDAEQAIEALVTTAPSYRPSESEASPRVRATFSEVRRRVLPVIVQQRYTAAKQAFDTKAFADAADGFRDVLDALADPDIAVAAGAPPLSDIRTLATGFHDLAVAAAAPPPPPPPPPPSPVRAAPAQPEPVAKDLRVYSSPDVDVAPPVVVRQSVPPFPKVGQGPMPASAGVFEIVISETGSVESFVVRSSISPTYDRMVQNAARGWTFQPATRRGVPVKYRKVLQIAISK